MSTEDKTGIAEVVSTMGLLTDQRDWAGVTALFADPVQVDYTSLNGGEPVTSSPADLVGGWRENLERLDATQHQISTHRVSLDGDTASCTANVVGTHVRVNHSGGPHWVVGGRYDLTLIRAGGSWLITALTLTVSWATGNQAIMTPAG